MKQEKTFGLTKAAVSPKGIAVGEKLDGYFDTQDRFFRATLNPSVSQEDWERLRVEDSSIEESSGPGR